MFGLHFPVEIEDLVLSLSDIFLQIPDMQIIALFMCLRPIDNGLGLL